MAPKNSPELPNTPETLPQTSLGVDKIKEDISLLKKDAEALESKRADFEKTKNTLSKEEGEKLKQEIEAEAQRIEAKKQELLTLIKQTKWELEVLKWNVETSTEKSQLDALEKEILSIQTSKQNMLEKARERGKANPKTAIVATAWVGLLVYGIVSLFKKKKAKQETGDKENKEGFRNHGIGKALKIWGIAVAWFFGIKWLYEKFKGDTMKTPDDLASDFDKLSEAEKLKYNGFGGKVNEMYTGIYHKEIDDNVSSDAGLGVWYNSTDLKKYEWVVPFAMDKTYSNIGAMLTEWTVNRHIFKKDIAEFKEIVGGFIKGELESLLLPSLMKIKSFSMLWSKPGEKLADKIIGWMDANPEEALKELDLFFRQFIMVLTYLEEKKIQLRKLLVIKKINEIGYGKDKKKLTGLSEDDQKDLIEDAMGDAKWMDANIVPTIKTEFDGQKIQTIASNLTKYQLYDGKISLELQEKITNLDETRDDLLDYDESSKTDILDRAETDIADGKLEKDNQKNLTECADDILDDAMDANGEWFMQRYFEPIAIACGMDQATREKFLQESGGKAMLDNFALGMTKYKEKFATGTMTKEDVTNFKILVNKYLMFKKEVIVAIHTIQNLHSEDPDAIGKRLNVFWSPFKALYACCTETMPFLDRTANFTRWMMGVGGVVYLVWGVLLKNKVFARTGKLMMKVWGIIPYGVFKASMAWVKYAWGKMIFSGYHRERKILESSDSEKLFRRAVMTWEINKKRAMRLAEKLKIKKLDRSDITTMDELLIRFWAKDEAEAKLIAKYLDNANMRKIFMEKKAHLNSGIRDRWKYDIYERSLKNEYTFLPTKLWQLKEIDAIIQANSTKKSAEVIKYMLHKVDAKQFDKLHDVIHTGGLAGDIDAIFVKMWSKLDAKDFGKLLGNHLDQFTDANDIKQFLHTRESANLEVKNFGIMIRKWKDIKVRLARWEQLPNILKQVGKNFVRIAPEIKVIDDLAAKKVAEFIRQKRSANLDNLLVEFEPKGKYAKYAEDFKARYRAAANDQRALQDLDMEFAKRLLREGKKVEDLLEFTAEQKAITNLVVGDIADLKKFITTDLPKQPGFQTNGILDIHYKTQLKSLEEFRYKIKWFTPQELTSFKNLRKIKFTSTHIVELFELWENNAEIKRILTQQWAEIDDLLDVIKHEEHTLEVAGKKVSKWLIEWLEELKRIKLAARAGDEVIDTIKMIFKFVAKVS